ncbi:hypothetical protein ACX4M5_00300 [Roseomonas mucosa]
MGVGIGNTVEGFKLFYDYLWDREFRKTIHLHKFSEREMLPLLRTFLLGYFSWRLQAEVRSSLPGSLTKHGRIDFVIGDVAVEFAVRRSGKSADCIGPKTNQSEVRKLLKHDGHALLVLFDLSRNPVASNWLEGYRELPSLGKGPHQKSAFNIAYYHLTGKRGMATDVIRKTIRAN